MTLPLDELKAAHIKQLFDMSEGPLEFAHKVEKATLTLKLDLDPSEDVKDIMKEVSEGERIKKLPVTEIEQSMPMMLNGGYHMLNYYQRMRHTQANMWAFVCWDWVVPFAEWIGSRRVLEVMCGAGWLARGLREKGVDITTTDNHSWNRPHKNRADDWKPYKLQTEIVPMHYKEAIRTYGKTRDILIISWPYMDSGAYNAIKMYHEVNPNGLVVYIGEGIGGCTANDRFFMHFKEVDDFMFDHAVSPMFKSWDMMHDTMRLGRYSPSYHINY